MLLTCKKRKSKRYWGRNIFSGDIDFAINLLEKLRLEGGMGFRNLLRKTLADFKILLQMVETNISKESTVSRVIYSISCFFLFLILSSPGITPQRHREVEKLLLFSFVSTSVSGQVDTKSEHAYTTGYCAALYDVPRLNGNLWLETFVLRQKSLGVF